jgi:hypothetical protein
MRLIKRSLAGPVLAGILAVMPAAAFAHGGGGAGGGGHGFGGGGGGHAFGGGGGGHAFGGFTRRGFSPGFSGTRGFSTGRFSDRGETRDLNPPLAVRPFGAPGQGPQRDSAEINAQKSEIGAQHLSPNPADSKARASINEKFQRYENKFASDPRMSDDRRERLNRTRAFLVNLIDFGYAPLTVDSWCDDLLDDRVDDGMPMDLVDTYWGQPVDTQEFVEYDVPYELYTYRTDDSDYYQVTCKNRVVSRPTPNVADVRTR